ncbi:hypothetical protein J31TS4_23760 [Paenibacillus sp. J31TS4]|nr:hypothetical protein J31TS4_23760 [Paenibacillus sp. J31TS4]
MEEGEHPVDACLREVREETGLNLDPSQLKDMGVLPYLKTKDLHLFVCRTDELPPLDAMACTTYFVHARSGKRLPEVDGYRYIRFEEAEERMTANMACLLRHAASLLGLPGSGGRGGQQT